VQVESLGILEFATRTKLRKERSFKAFKGKMRVKVVSKKVRSEGRRQLFGQEVLRT
jgi:hypothetical protein